MNIPTEMVPAQKAAADAARNWTTDPAAHVRLGCLNCMDVAEGQALENGATEAEAVEWAASYLSQGDSLGCWKHDV